MSPYSVEHFPDDMGSEVALKELRKNLGLGVGTMDPLRRTVTLLSLFSRSKRYHERFQRHGQKGTL